MSHMAAAAAAAASPGVSRPSARAAWEGPAEKHATAPTTASPQPQRAQASAGRAQHEAHAARASAGHEGPRKDADADSVFDLQKLLFGMHAGRARGHHGHHAHHAHAHHPHHPHHGEGGHDGPHAHAHAHHAHRRHRNTLHASEERFEKTLLDPALGLPFVLLDVAPRVHAARTALSLALTLEWHGVASRLVTALVRMETAMGNKPSDFLQEDRPGSHVVRAFLRIHGLRFLRNALVLTFAEFTELQFRLRTRQRTAAAPRVDPLDVLLAAQEVVDAVALASDKVPVSVKRVLGEVVDAHAAVGGARAAHGPVCAAHVFFDLMICPAVAEPVAYGLCAGGVLDHYAKRVVLLMARLLSNTARGVPFLEPTLAPFNLFVRDNHRALVTLVSQLAASRSALPRLAHELVPFTIPPAVRVSATEFLASIASNAREDMEALIGRTQPGAPRPTDVTQRTPQHTPSMSRLAHRSRTAETLSLSSRSSSSDSLSDDSDSYSDCSDTLSDASSLSSSLASVSTSSRNGASSVASRGKPSEQGHTARTPSSVARGRSVSQISSSSDSDSSSSESESPAGATTTPRDGAQHAAHPQPNARPTDARDADSDGSTSESGWESGGRD